MAARLRPRLESVAGASVVQVVAGTAASAAALTAAFSVGTWGVLAVLLAVAAWDLGAAGVAGLAALAVAARFGTTGLAELAGTQSVLGPAALLGPPSAAASAWFTAGALLLVSPGRLLAVPFGLAAGLVLAGPGGSTAGGLAVRLVAAVACVELAVAAPHLAAVLPRRPAVPVLLASAGAAAAFLGRPDGWQWGVDGAGLARGVAVAAAVSALTAAAVLLVRLRIGAPDHG